MIDAPDGGMHGLAGSLLISIGLIIVLWLVGQAFGFRVSVLGSVALTIVLTIVMNLILRD